MTDKEIQLACEKSGAYEIHEEKQKSNPPPLPQSNIYQYSNNQISLTFFDRLREIVHNIAIFSIVAYIVHKFYEVSIELLL